MNNDNAETPFSNSPKVEVAARSYRKLSQSHDAAARSQNISQDILTTLAEWHRADHTARRPESAAAATRPRTLQREGRFYAPATPSRPAAAFEATYLKLAD